MAKFDEDGAGVRPKMDEALAEIGFVLESNGDIHHPNHHASLTFVYRSKRGWV